MDPVHARLGMFLDLAECVGDEVSEQADPDEAERIAEGANQTCLAHADHHPGCGLCVCATDDLAARIRAYAAEQVRAAVQAERERCARQVREMKLGLAGKSIEDALVAAIEVRGGVRP